jgi:hypothetical protein
LCRGGYDGILAVVTLWEEYISAVQNKIIPVARNGKEAVSAFTAHGCAIEGVSGGAVGRTRWKGEGKHETIPVSLQDQQRQLKIQEKSISLMKDL